MRSLIIYTEVFMNLRDIIEQEKNREWTDEDYARLKEIEQQLTEHKDDEINIMTEGLELILPNKN